MMDLDTLPDEELGAHAVEWRKRALQGDRNARGIAHEFETELRRRAGAVLQNYDALDLRSLEISHQRRWWQLR